MVHNFLGKKRQLDDNLILQADESDQSEPPLKKTITMAEYNEITLTKRSDFMYKCVKHKRNY